MKIAVLLALSIVAVLGSGLDLTGQALPRSEMYGIYGDRVNGSFGKSVSYVGDVNSDGLPDFVVGAYQRVASRGAASVRSGASPNHVIWIAYGSGSELFGYSVSGISDVDGDQVPDVIVGAPHADNPGSSVPRTGRVTVFSGVSGAPIGSAYGVDTDDEFGFAVSEAGGDIDGDGWPDFIVGAPHATNVNGLDHGTATLLSGRTPSTKIDTLSGGLSFGSSVGCMQADVDGDGWPDFLVGAPSEDRPGTPFAHAHGSATLFSGHLVGSTWPVLHKIYGDRGRDNLGVSVSGLGDLDGDLIPEFVAGAHLADNPRGDLDCGLARIYSGAVRTGLPPTLLYTLFGDSILDQFGIAVSAAGDVNGDGFDDVIIGAQGDSASTTNGNGYARVFDGPTGTPLFTMIGDGLSLDGIPDSLGHSVGGLGDINGDGFDDVIVGAPWDDDPHDFYPPNRDHGSIWIYSGTCGEIGSFGVGCAGNGGCIPELTVRGCAALRSRVSLVISNGEGGARTLMLVAAGPANPPLAFPSGCFLDVPAPPTSVLLNLLPLFDSGGCNGYMGITLTALRSPPVSVHFQVVIRDSVVGWITTNGVTVQIP